MSFTCLVATPLFLFVCFFLFARGHALCPRPWSAIRRHCRTQPHCIALVISRWQRLFRAVVDTCGQLATRPAGGCGDVRVVINNGQLLMQLIRTATVLLIENSCSHCVRRCALADRACRYRALKLGWVRSIFVLLLFTARVFFQGAQSFTLDCALEVVVRWCVACFGFSSVWKCSELSL